MDWRNQNQVFEKIGVYNRDSYNLTGMGEAGTHCHRPGFR